MVRQALDRAIAEFGSQAALAAKIGVAQQNVAYWRKRSSLGVPAEMCRRIEKATRGKVTRQNLRPDLFDE